MKDIESVETCMTPTCFPFGVLLTMRDGGKYKLGITKLGRLLPKMYLSMDGPRRKP